ncbi:MAG: pyridoxal-phosphate dependent enzyme [Anaerolineae bacterium]|nr:pyridoxal-phosphate dependent enzyme [Anaerolineae bacterium]
MTTLSTKPNTPSTANGQRCLYCGATFPLYPPILGGCPNCASDGFLAPIEVTYDYPATADWLPDSPLPGITRYAPLLPPLVDWVSMGEGGTALVPVPGSDVELYVKDESRNPTWSHKDRLNLAVISAALAINAPGVIAASSGNHGAAAAAYAARAGLPCVILCTPRPPAVASFLQAYGQLVVAVPDAPTRWTLMSRLIDEYGYHPASNYTNPPTNHPFGSENYKTIAYELFLQLGRRAPEAVFIPTGYAELAFGVGKGFAELERYGLIKQRPHIVACEPSAGAPLQQALAAGKPIATVNAKASDAYAITVPVNGYRGVVAVRDSEGLALPVSDDEMRLAQAKLGKMGLWSEFSSAISFAGALRSRELGLGQSGPLVCISTSSGFKDNHVGENPVPLIDGSWEAFHALFEQYQQNR